VLAAGVNESHSTLTLVRWTWCPVCLTVFDDYGNPVNPIPEYTKVR